MSAAPSIELSTADSWRGVRPGMPRAEVVALLTAAGLKDFDDPGDPEWVLVGEWGFDLQFDEEGEQILRQIAISETPCSWAGQPVLDQPLHAALEAIGLAAELASWRPESAVDYVLQDLAEPKVAAPSDEDLLERGTLWLPRVRLGLVMEHGRIAEIAWRRAEDVPRLTTGPVTESQLALSRDPKEAAVRLVAGHGGRKLISTLRLMLTAVFALALIGIGVFAVQSHQHWSTAPRAKARVVGIEEQKSPARMVFTVEFADEEDHRQRATLQQRDFYIAPQAAGEEVEVRYLPTEPVSVRGPASARDGEFLQFLPWVMGAALAYGVLMSLLGWFDGRRKIS